MNNQSDKILSSLNEADYPLLGIYFSAHWCPPCKAFTPKLATFYNNVNKKEKVLEIVFFSWDNSEEEFKDYFSHMPWKAITLGNEKINQVAGSNGIKSIPTLLIFKNGKLVSKTARNSVANCHNEEDQLNLIEEWLA
jgi:nucleoredoxin